MHILISGASGLIGSSLRTALVAAGNRVSVLVRHPPRDESEYFWLPAEEKITLPVDALFDAVVHLAGESVASGPWTVKKRESILNSRVQGTKTLIRALGQLNTPPRSFVSASAVGYYGDRGDTILTEDGSPGEGFLASVCKVWEQEALRAAELGARVVCARFGLVLSGRGGVLQKILPLYRLGLGGPLGHGTQYMSWVHSSDVTRALHYILTHESLLGPVNVVAPESVTNGVFARELASQLRKPAVARVPAFALKLILKDFATEMLLGSTRVVPKKLLDTGFVFEYPRIDEALRQIVSQNK